MAILLSIANYKKVSFFAVIVWGYTKEIDAFQNQIGKFFKPEYLQKKAVETEFFKRTSKLLPAKFFEVLLFSGAHIGRFSLRDFSSEILKSFKIRISKQGFNDRFNDEAVIFIKSVFEDLMANQLKLNFDPNFLKHFNRVKIKDGTKFKLDKSLEKSFKGFGKGAESVVSLQLEYDAKNSEFLELDITSGNFTDAAIAKKRVANLQKGDLDIFDLGYFHVGTLKKIEEKEAFFLSRLITSVSVFSADNKEISFKDLYAEMKKKKIVRKEISVLISAKEKMPVRLFVEIVPDTVYEERIRVRKSKKKKHNSKISDETIIRARFNLMITNIDKEIVTVDNVKELYKTRWQIELIFKIWKSTYGIDRVHKVKYNRLMCFLYAKLILLLINGQVVNLLQARIHKKGNVMLSNSKCHKTLVINIKEMLHVLMRTNEEMNQYLYDLFEILVVNHNLEKRKNKLSYLEIIQLYSC